ncbi:MAG: hypothetical protein AAFY19_12935, partial [Pseudomonadota bacterium]
DEAMRRLNPAFAIAFALAACGPDLGKHQFQDARRASQLPSHIKHSRKDLGYVVLRFRTERNLNSAELNALYAQASACPFDEAASLPAFGPFTDDSARRTLPADERTDAHTSYLVYLPIEGEIYGELENGRTPEIGRFDLRTGNWDLCVRVEHTGFPMATRTKPIRIPRSAISAAISP